MRDQFAVLSLNVGQFDKKRIENNLSAHILKQKGKIIDYVDKFFIEKPCGVVIFQEVLYKRKGNRSNTRVYDELKSYYTTKGYTFYENKQPSAYNQTVTVRFRTLAISKNSQIELMDESFHIDNQGSMWAKWVELEYRDYVILGVHVPQGSFGVNRSEMDAILFWDSICIYSLRKMQENKKLIIIGDMNVNPNVSTTSTDRVNLLKHINVRNKYMLDAWEHSVTEKKAFIINKDSEDQEQPSNVINKVTFFGKGEHTRIDYALCSSDIIIEKMIVDDRVIEFTDHSAIRLEIRV